MRIINDVKRFIPFEKLSKKEQLLENKKRRRGWGALKPVTRTPPDPKAYDRNKEKKDFKFED